MHTSMEKMNITPGTTNSFLRDYQRIHPFFKVDSFSWLVKAEIATYTSGVFESGGYKWKLILYPNGRGTKEATPNDSISLFLSIEETESWPPKWEIKVDVKLLVYNHIKKKYVTIKDCGEQIKRFNEFEKEWGFSELFDLKTFMDETNGFLLNDCCVFAAEVFEELDDNIDTRTKCFPIKGYNIQNGTLRMVRELGPAHFLFPIKSFAAIDQKEGELRESNSFEAGGVKWRLSLYPNGNRKANVKDHISLYLRIEETSTFDPNWEVHVTLKFFIYDNINKNYLTVQDLDGTPRRFDKLKEEWGLDRLIPVNDFKYISNGFLLDDSSCTFGVEVLIVKEQGKSPNLPPVVPGTHVHTWILNNFSAIESYRDSEKFAMGGTNWSLRVFPHGNTFTTTSMCLYLVIETADAIFKWDIIYKFRVLDQINNNHHEMTGNYSFTCYPATPWSGIHNFVPLERLNNPSSGFIKNNTVVVQVIFDSIHRG